MILSSKHFSKAAQNLQLLSPRLLTLDVYSLIIYSSGSRKALKDLHHSENITFAVLKGL